MPTPGDLTRDEIALVWRYAVGPGPHCRADADLMHDCTVALNHYGDFTTREQDGAMTRVRVALQRMDPDVRAALANLPPLATGGA